MLQGRTTLVPGIILTAGITSGAEGSYTGGPNHYAFGSGDKSGWSSGL